jgi:hypothetical protein
MSSTLPDPIRRHLERNVPSSVRPPVGVRIAQEGELWLKPGGRRLRFRATEELATAEVAFRWRARARLAPLVWLDVVDGYEDGAGRLEGRLWGRLRLLHAVGPEIDEGEALRYLAELPWVPYALAANRSLEWREAGRQAVDVSARGGVVRLRVDGDGDVVAASARRGRREGRAIVSTPWGGTFGDYAAFGGVRIPTRAEVSWELPGGPFTYFRARVTDLVEVAA